MGLPLSFALRVVLSIFLQIAFLAGFRDFLGDFGHHFVFKVVDVRFGLVVALAAHWYRFNHLILRIAKKKPFPARRRERLRKC